MIALAFLLLQAPAAPIAPASPRTPVNAAATGNAATADTIKPIDSTVAIDLFKSVCWTNFRDAQAFHAAVVAAPVPLTPVPRAATDSGGQPNEVFRSDEAVLTYVASDSLPASIPSRQCSLRVRLAGVSDQLALAARIGAALGLPNGKTRTGPTLAITSWDVPGTDNRTTRLLAISRNGRSGGTELRLSALLLTAR